MMAGRCMFLMRCISNKVDSISVSARYISMSTKFCYENRPRVLPVTHQVAGDHNSQFFTSYPHLTREECEEPPPKVSEEVKELLERSREISFQNDFRKPDGFIDREQFEEIKANMIKEGHYFPDEPEEDLFLQIMPKVQKRYLKTEARLKRIEENMKMMPQWIAEYKERYRQQLLKEKEEASKNKVDQMEMKRFGLHPKDPRSKQLLAAARRNKASTSETKVKKKKYGKKAKE